MNSKNAHTIKHRPGVYHVRTATGVVVARYPYDRDDFQARRQAYRDALADAALRDEVAERRAVTAAIFGQAA